MQNEKRNEPIIEKIEKPKKSLIRRIIRLCMMGGLIFILLNTLLYIALSIPFIQQKAVNFASDKLSEMLRTEVTIREVRFDLLNHAYIRGLYVADQAKDTLVYAEFLDAKVRPWDLVKHNQLKIKHVILDDFFINLYKTDSIGDYNFQFIVDKFASTDTTAVDTTSSSMGILVDDVKITKGRFVHRILSDSITPNEFNVSDIYLNDFHANLRINSVDVENLDIEVHNISAKEKSGLQVNSLQGNVFSKGSKFWGENLALTLPRSHLKLKNASYNINTDAYELETEDTKVSTQDILPFYPDLKFLTKDLTLRTKLSGKLPLIDVESLTLAYGDDVLLDGRIFFSNYENLEEAVFDITINELSASKQGLSDFAKLGDSEFVMPAIVDTLGRLHFDASLIGKLKDFTLQSKLSTKQGIFKLDTKGMIDTSFTNFDLKAKLYTKQFNLKPILGAETGFGDLDMHVNLDVTQKGENTLTAKLRGAIDTLDIMHGQVIDLPFGGYYNPQKLGFAADAKLHFGRIIAGFELSSDKKPDIKFGLSVSDFDVAHFIHNKLWDNPKLKFKLKGEIKSFDIDDLKADIGIKELLFIDSTFNYQPGDITLKAGRDANNNKFINLNSTIASANVRGDYKFSTLSEEFDGLMHDYLSNVFEANKKKTINANDFTFDFTLYNTEELGFIFDLPFDIIDPLQVDGRINTVNRKITVDGLLPYIRSSSLDIKGTKLSIANQDSAFNIGLNTKVLMEDRSFYELGFTAIGADNSIGSLFTVDSDSLGTKVHGFFDGMAQFTIDEDNELISSFKIIPSDIVVGDLDVKLLPAQILYRKERVEIHNIGIGVNGQKYIGIEGAISENKNDTLKIQFTHAELDNLLKPLNINNIKARIYGDVAITNAMSSMEIHTEDLEMADIIVFSDTLGTLKVHTHVGKEYGGMILESALIKNNKKQISIEGTLNGAQKLVDLHMDIDRFSINWLEPFMAGLLNKISGDISSHLTVKGKYDDIQTEGFLGFNNAKIGIDYTNVVYNIADTIKITPDRIGFDNLKIKDNQGNEATVNARVTHRNFKDMKYQLDMRLKNFMVLNTVSRTDSLFYGRLYASGNLKIEGDDNGIDLNMNVKNDKNSFLNVVIPQTSEAVEYKSIVYINIPKEKLPKEDKKKREFEREEEIPIRLNMKLDVDPGIALGVVIDPETGDRMNIKGNGSIKFNYDMSTDAMNLYGDYTVKDGSVRLNLQNISKLEFKIKEGSKVNFVGNPFSTKFDITAYRRVKADLKTLDPSFEMEASTTRVKVDCLLGIKGNINKMDLGYDIELFDAPEDLQRKVHSIVNTDEQRIKQFAYLIAAGRFYSNTGGSGANFTDGMWTNLASGALSSGLNAAFGNILGDKWEIGTDISSNDGSFSDMDMSVNVSTRLLDDKLKLHTNLGYRTDGSGSGDDSFIGDFDVEYQLNPTWTLKAYNHTNDRFYKQAPTTQGVGIVFTREARTLKRLFTPFKRRRRDEWRDQESSGEYKRTDKEITEKEKKESGEGKEKEDKPKDPHQDRKGEVIAPKEKNDIVKDRK